MGGAIVQVYNFQFLEKDWEILARVRELAERNVYQSPNMTQLKIEQIVKVEGNACIVIDPSCL